MNSPRSSLNTDLDSAMKNNTANTTKHPVHIFRVSASSAETN